MKNHQYASSSSQTKDDNKGVERKKNEFMQQLLHHDAGESINNPTTKTRTRPHGWIDDKTRKQQHQQPSQSAATNAMKKHPFPPRKSAQLPKPRSYDEFRRGEEVF